MLLFLSRTREYYADKFAAEETDPNVLANALIKIALGILATPENSDLVRSTQHMNIANVKISQSL
ncbi:M48 family metalloprotease [Patescibacteria group bacterium]|nr:M48 family metalloprotease [Patescibacteria group bacterium]